jgi:hypothetical protein
MVYFFIYLKLDSWLVLLASFSILVLFLFIIIIIFYKIWFKLWFGLEIHFLNWKKLAKKFRISLV